MTDSEALTEALLPCRSCGVSEAEIGVNAGWFSVECQNCPCRTGTYRSPAEAVAAWNRRMSALGTAPAEPVGYVYKPAFDTSVRERLSATMWAPAQVPDVKRADYVPVYASPAPARADQVEIAAEAMWRHELDDLSPAASNVRRQSVWAEQSDNTKSKWRGHAEAAILALSEGSANGK